MNHGRLLFCETNCQSDPRIDYERARITGIHNARATAHHNTAHDTTLADHERILMYLRTKGYTYREISTILDIHLSSVNNMAMYLRHAGYVFDTPDKRPRNLPRLATTFTLPELQTAILQSRSSFWRKA